MQGDKWYQDMKNFTTTRGQSHRPLSFAYLWQVNPHPQPQSFPTEEWEKKGLENGLYNDIQESVPCLYHLYHREEIF